MSRRNLTSFIVGCVVGTLGGLIGLGGAEFRLPLLISLFGFEPLAAVILNKAMSLVVVAAALPSRIGAVPLEAIFEHWTIVANLLVGSLTGAWVGASWAVRLQSSSFYKVIAVLLVLMAVALLFGHGMGSLGQPVAHGMLLVLLGTVAGFGIGVVASLLGVAGGELLIPTLVLLFGLDVKLAGSLSLAISLPTMLVGFLRYSRDRSFSVLREQIFFAANMAAGSFFGAFLGGQLLKFVDTRILLPCLSALLLISAVKLLRGKARP